MCNLKVHKQTTNASFNYRFLFFVNSGNCTIRFTSFLLSSFVRYNLTIGQRNLRKQCSKDTTNLHVVLCRNFRQNTVLFFRSDRLHSGETVHVLRGCLQNEDRRPKTEDRRPKTEDRRPKNEDRKTKTEKRRPKNEDPNFFARIRHGQLKN